MPGLEELINPQGVRLLINASYTIRDLPDNVIQDPIFVDPVVSDVLRRDPDAAGRGGEEQKHIKTAINHLLAAKILPAVPQLVKEDFGDGGGWTLEKVDIEERVSDLLGIAAAEIAVVLKKDKPESKSRPTFFTVARANR